MSRTTQQGFTFIELLVTVAIIGLLMIMMMPIVSVVRDAAKSVKCMSNIRQLSLGSIAYTADNRGMMVSASQHFETTIPAAAPNDHAVYHKSFADLLDDYIATNQDVHSAYGDARMVHSCPMGLPALSSAALKDRIRQFGPQWPLHYGANFSAHGLLKNNPWFAEHGFPADGPLYVQIRQGQINRPSEVVSFGDVALASGIGTCAGWITYSDDSLLKDPNRADQLLDAAMPGDWTAQGNADTLPGQIAGVYRLRYRHRGNSLANIAYVDGHVASVPFMSLQFRNFAISY